MVRRRPNSCLVTWRRIGLTVNFGTIGTDPADPCRAGGAFSATITGRGRWRTALGLRVGDGVARLRVLYPRATLHQGAAFENGYWLLTRRSAPLSARCLTRGSWRASSADASLRLSLASASATRWPRQPHKRRGRCIRRDCARAPDGSRPDRGRNLTPRQSCARGPATRSVSTTAGCDARGAAFFRSRAAGEVQLRKGCEIALRRLR